VSALRRERLLAVHGRCGCRATGVLLTPIGCHRSLDAAARCERNDRRLRPKCPEAAGQCLGEDGEVRQRAAAVRHSHAATRSRGETGGTHGVGLRTQRRRFKSFCFCSASAQVQQARIQPMTSSRTAPTCSVPERCRLIETNLSGVHDITNIALETARALGRIVPPRRGQAFVQRLEVKDGPQASPTSFSGLFGAGEFPMHTECANWTVPPRFLVLASVTATRNSGETRVSPAPSYDSSIAEGVFVVRNGRHSFLASIADRHRSFIRFDPICMKPTDNRSHAAMSRFAALSEQMPRHSIQWKRGDILVIDNWQVLHGRGPALRGRVLLRIYVEG
jgi:TfdA family taurine catabolism dioxygenase TauD